MSSGDQRTTDDRLLEDWQRDLPLVSQPFAAIARELGIGESQVIERLSQLRERGSVARVGAVVRPNVIGASTLAAMRVPDLDVDEIAAIVGKEPGVNHSYLRENTLNFWFVATGPDRGHVDAALKRIGKNTQLEVLDLRLERQYYIDLGFSLERRPLKHHPSAEQGTALAAFVAQDGDRELIQKMTEGLPLITRPFEEIARQLGIGEARVLTRLSELAEIGVLPRIGIIVRHRTLGWRSNAMVVWDVPPHDIDRAGAALAAQPAVTLCYRRRRYENDWPYNLYCMVHARSREEAHNAIDEAAKAATLEGCTRQILFSLRCFKQTGAMLVAPKEAA